MHFQILFQNQPIGYLELRADGFELNEISDEQQKQVLHNILNAYFTLGIKGGIDKDELRTETLRPDDPRFALELATRLSALGYQLTQ